MDASTSRRFGRLPLSVTALGLGTAPLGNQFRVVTEADSQAVFDEAWNAGIRYFDTAPMYGHGLAEHRTGEALRLRNRHDYILSTKVGRMLVPARREEVISPFWVDPLPFQVSYDYSYDGVMRSVEDSLQRLALEYIDIAFIHDIDVFTHGPEQQPVVFRQAMEGAYKALHRLREEGVLKAIGVGMNEWQACQKALEEADFDCFLLAGRYTLLEQDALDSFLPLCVERNVAIVLGGCYNSGILGTGAIAGAYYNYGPAPQPIIDRVAKIESICREFSVSLKAAALQFVLAHPAIPTVLAGTRSAKHMKENIALLSQGIPAEFWDALRQSDLIRPDAPTPASAAV
ncbi:aldo/keto reductase [Acidisoma cellulosilytica]|uniref:Aldo/keto reductase n=1 Tax=Acidisoma cellulosilyticum TaxID=2802395 RepID=A0A963Z3A0_9PROT|nr:aldo/keto reductase [Acidisoma cellulosilyticum]MCB8882052.1 aldo/keto reductase [Acidisoma cellulosilyticum]